MDAQWKAWVDQEEARMKDMIRRHGWAVQAVGGGGCSNPNCECQPDDGPPFAYTVGLFGMGHPELLIFGLPPTEAARILNAVGERVRQGENLVPGQLLTLPGAHHQFVVEEVPNPGEIVFLANDFYRRPDEFSVPVLQLTYDDGLGVFPWDEGFPAPEMQPRPGTFRA